jgi:hypothetical protein
MRRQLTYDDLIATRLAYYEPRLPAVDNEFRGLDSRMRLRFEQHDLLDQRLADLLVMPRPEMLATTEERQAGERLDAMLAALADRDDDTAEALRARIARVRGALIWRLRTEYHERLTRFDSHLRELQTAVTGLQDTYHAYVRVRQAATHSYQGYDRPFKRLQTRVDAALNGVNRLMARQGTMLEQVAVAELQSRHRRLENYQDQARYAMADSYDRATKNLQAGGE